MLYKHSEPKQKKASTTQKGAEGHP